MRSWSSQFGSRRTIRSNRYDSRRTLLSSSRIETQDTFQDAITLPRFVYLMAKLGVEGPRQNEVSLDTILYEKVGEGAQFQVFRRQDTNTVAKRVSLQIMTGTDSEQLRDLELEITVLTNEKVRIHPNIVDLIGWGYDIVREPPIGIWSRRDIIFPLQVPVLYVEPAISSLDEFLTATTPWDTRIHLCLDIAAGLECLRECGILHNDLKPQNILVFHRDKQTGRKMAKLADFGLAIASSEDNHIPFEEYGKTRTWKPPESSDYSEKKHGNPSHLMLFRSESYAYGLLALYTMFSRNTESPPLPFSQNRATRQAEIDGLLGAHAFPQADKILALNVWHSIEKHFLPENPINRDDVALSILMDQDRDATVFTTW